jgi:CheY-specific phosphatase CheX
MSEWMDALHDTTREVATTALGFEGSEILKVSAATPDGLEGAYLALVGQADSIQIGLASSEEGCQALSRALLAMEADAPDVEPADVADAMCEIVNIVAGGIKTRVNGKVPPIKLGLPIFVKGAVQPSSRLVILVAEILLGTVPAALILVEPRSA